MLKQKLSRIQYNLKRYGILSALKKIIYYIFKLNRKTEKVQKQRYQKWILQNEPNLESLQKQRDERFEQEPKISIVVPMYNTQENFFLELFNSLLAQTYKNWELCFADGSDEQNETIYAMCSRCSKVKYKFLGKNNGISENTNQALEMATGDFIGFLDHDDCLSPFALYEIVKTINENSEVEFIYSDEDKINENGERFEPHFKPDFSPEAIECHNYITHFVVIKKSLLERIGSLDNRFDGAQDFDFVLRATENTKNIIHIPQILYHWRAHQNSTANVVNTKNYAYEAGTKVIDEHLKRIGKEGMVKNPEEVPGMYQIKYAAENDSKVSIVIFNKNDYKTLKNCLKSILELTSYKNYEVILLKVNSDDKKLSQFYQKIEQNPKVRVIFYEESELNHAKMINFAVKNADGDFILQLNSSSKILTPDWLEIFIGYAKQKQIGAVGARIYDAKMRLKNAGIALRNYRNSRKFVRRLAIWSTGTFWKRSTDFKCVSCKW